MKKVLKVVGVLFLLFVIAAIAAPFIFKGKIKQAVKDIANENLNAQVDFSDVSLSLISSFPSVTVDIQDLSILGKGAFEGLPLVTSEDVVLDVGFMSLFGDELAVKNISLVKPGIYIKVLENGSANYDIALAGDSTTVPETESAGASAFQLDIERYSIQEGNFVYEDLSLPYKMELKNIEHTGTGNFAQDIFVLDTKTTALAQEVNYDGTNYVNAAPMDLDAKIEMDLEQMKFTFQENALKINELVLNADGFMDLNDEDMVFDLTFNTPNSDIRQLLSMVPAEFSKDLDGVKTSGNLAFDGFFKGKMDDNTMPGFGLNLKVDQGMFRYPDLPSSVDNIFIQSSISAAEGADYDNMTIAVPKMHAEMDGNPVDLKLLMQGIGASALIDADILAKVDLEKLKNVIPMDDMDALKGLINADVSFAGKMADIEAEKFDKITANGQIIVQDFMVKSKDLLYDMEISNAYATLTPRELKLTRFESMIGDNDIQLEGGINNYIEYAMSDCLLEGKMNLTSKKLDLNTFMEESESAVEGSASAEEALGVIPIPANIDFDMTANIQELIYDNVSMTNVTGGLNIKDRVAELKNLQLNTLGGSVVVDGSYSTLLDQKPSIDIDYGIKSLDIATAVAAFDIIAEMAPIAKYCAGKFSTNMKFKSDLDETMSPIYSSIDGSGKLQTAKVLVEKFVPLNKIANELGIDRLKRQDIENVNLSYYIQDGKVVVDPYEIKLDGITTNVGGWTNFDQEINYQVAMLVPASKLGSTVNDAAQGVLGMINNKLGSNISAGSSIPLSFTITGTITDPKIKGNVKESLTAATQDIKEQVKEEVKEQIQEEIKEVKEDVSAKAREEADKILADAQKQADNIMSEARKAADKVKKEGYAAADKLEAEAKNPLEKFAAKKTADKLREKTDASAKKITDEAQKKTDNIMNKARSEADKKVNSITD